jgi:hypothetical protein
MIEIDIYRLTGSRSNGAESDGGRLYHALPKHTYTALCGRKPGPRSDWSSYPGQAVTCKRCVSRLEELAIMAAKPDENGIW